VLTSYSTPRRQRLTPTLAYLTDSSTRHIFSNGGNAAVFRRRLRRGWSQSQTFQGGDRVRRRKLELFSHICRMPDNRLLKKVLYGMLEGHNCQGRPRNRWVDDRLILKWCNMTLQEASYHAQDRVKWRTFIAGPYGSWTTGQEEERKKEDTPDPYSLRTPDLQHR